MLYVTPAEFEDKIHELTNNFNESNDLESSPIAWKVHNLMMEILFANGYETGIKEYYKWLEKRGYLYLPEKWWEKK